eukprot:125331-Prymnesium_polylepis.1
MKSHVISVAASSSRFAYAAAIPSYGMHISTMFSTTRKVEKLLSHSDEATSPSPHRQPPGGTLDAALPFSAAAAAWAVTASA